MKKKKSSAILSSLIIFTEACEANFDICKVIQLKDEIGHGIKCLVKSSARMGWKWGNYIKKLLSSLCRSDTTSSGCQAAGFQVIPGKVERWKRRWKTLNSIWHGERERKREGAGLRGNKVVLIRLRSCAATAAAGAIERRHRPLPADGGREGKTEGEGTR